MELGCLLRPYVWRPTKIHAFLVPSFRLGWPMCALQNPTSCSKFLFFCLGYCLNRWVFHGKYPPFFVQAWHAPRQAVPWCGKPLFDKSGVARANAMQALRTPEIGRALGRVAFFWWGLLSLPELMNFKIFLGLDHFSNIKLGYFFGASHSASEFYVGTRRVFPASVILEPPCQWRMPWKAFHWSRKGLGSV